MPIPRRDVHDNATGFDWTMKQRRNVRKEERDNAAGEMKAMHRRENVNERTAGATSKMKSFGGKFAPDEKLSCKKSQTENGGQREKREAAFVSQRNTWNRANAASRVISRRAISMVTLLIIRTAVLASKRIQGKRTGTHVRA